MKLSTIRAYGFSILMTAALGLSACGQKKDDGVVGTNNGRTSISGNTATPTNPGGHVDQAFYLTGGSVTNFDQNVKDFLSAQITPDGVGDITDQSVIMTGYLETTANGQINGSASSLKIWIYDSFAKASGFDPFYIVMNQNVTGTFNSSQVTATFRSDLREVTLQGTISGGQIMGTLSFRNLKDAAGGSLKSAQPMGSFVTSTCALLNCAQP